MTAVSVGSLTKDNAKVPGATRIGKSDRVELRSRSANNRVPRSPLCLSFLSFHCGTRHARISPSKESEHENTDGPDIARPTGQHWPPDRILAGGIRCPLFRIQGCWR